MSEIRLFLPGIPPSKKNSRKAINLRGTRVMVPNDDYKEWERKMGWNIRSQVKMDQPIDYPVTLTVIFFCPDKTRWDLSNKLESIQDCLVKWRILKGDHRQIVKKLIVTYQDVNTEGAVQIIIS